ncbi:MAG: hydroxymethylbilane synthase [Deltaproteobacteria bacterium]|nr:hydroxymethylbilane synthase [Deltaproteobacteria bacterium]NIS77424.1 hydroxymethylbilane synthase [Deltaproteobacteria bacterium]
MGKKRVYLGTRGSMLALWQANHIKDRIEQNSPDVSVELVRIKTTGDKILDVPLAKVGGKALFVKEIEEALLDGKVDFAVHSMKDVPTVIPAGLEIAVATEREDPRDALVSPSGKKFHELPGGALIGTSSLRRQSQALHVRGDLKIEVLRGNLDTRLRKVSEGVFDAVILAAAGLKRMNWEDRITECIDPAVMIPAVGQGALGIEVRVDDAETKELISFLNHEETAAAVSGERAFLEKLEGGCQVPIGAHGVVNGRLMRITGFVASTDGMRMVRGEVTGEVSDSPALGRALAEDLLSRGGGEILEEIYKEA